MRRIRLTYPGAFHHVMNRGYNGNNIFSERVLKAQFLEYLADAAAKLKIRLFGYSIMDNHFHLVLENSTSRMSDFMKLLNGNYGSFYRKKNGGKEYVFQSRFKSTLIENQAYLIQSILYLLMNPVRAGIVTQPGQYLWSSIKEYFSDTEQPITDAAFVNKLFGSRAELSRGLKALGKREPAVTITKYGGVMGDPDFITAAMAKFDRRKRPSHQSIGYQREAEVSFEPVEKVIQEFENKFSVNINEINTETIKGKRLRGELLVQIKNRSGKKYKEIADIPLFGALNLSSLRSIYRNYRK